MRVKNHSYKFVSIHKVISAIIFAADFKKIQLFLDISETIFRYLAILIAIVK